MLAMRTRPKLTRLPLADRRHGCGAADAVPRPAPTHSGRSRDGDQLRSFRSIRLAAPQWRPAGAARPGRAVPRAFHEAFMAGAKTLRVGAILLLLMKLVHPQAANGGGLAGPLATMMLIHLATGAIGQEQSLDQRRRQGGRGQQHARTQQSRPRTNRVNAGRSAMSKSSGSSSTRSLVMRRSMGAIWRPPRRPRWRASDGPRCKPARARQSASEPGHRRSDVAAADAGRRLRTELARLRRAAPGARPSPSPRPGLPSIRTRRGWRRCRP